MLFEHQRTGHAPTGVTVVVNEDTLVITLRGGLSEVDSATGAVIHAFTTGTIVQVFLLRPPAPHRVLEQQ